MDKSGISALERGSEKILQKFEDLGQWAEGLEDANIANGTASVITQSASAQDGLNTRYVERVLKNDPIGHFDENFINHHFAGPFKPGKITKVLNVAGGFLDAGTGILDAAKAFRKDRTAGDTTYRGTMLSISSSVAQTSGGVAVGVIMGGAAAAVVGTVTLPILIGGAAGYGAGVAIGEFIEWISG